MIIIGISAGCTHHHYPFYPYHPLFVNKSREGINNKASQSKSFRLSSSVFLDPFLHRVIWNLQFEMKQEDTKQRLCNWKDL